MKLTSRSDLVKPNRSTLAIAALAVVVTVAAVHLVLLATSQAQNHMDRFGDSTAGALAEVMAEPVMRRDRMHLGVIGNRVVEAPEIRGVATYSADDEVLASSGELQEPRYTAPATINGNVVGYVRVAVEPAAFAEGNTSRTLSLLAILLLVPLLVAVAWTLGDAARRGELRGLLPQGPAWLRRGDPGWPEPPPSETAEAAGIPAVQPEIRHYLLAVNLYNQLTLPATEREFELTLCLELAEAVAEVYQGQVVALPGVGALVDFDHTGEQDRAFQVLRAAFVLVRLLRDEAPFGHYRLGLNLTERPADEALPLDDEAVADAALLSALARDGTLAISAPFDASLDGEERVRSRPLVNPLLDELTTSGPACHLVLDLEPPFDTLVLQQAEQLKGQRDTVSNPSTF